MDNDFACSSRNIVDAFSVHRSCAVHGVSLCNCWMLPPNITTTKQALHANNIYLTCATPPLPERALQMDCAWARLTAEPPPLATALATACAAHTAFPASCCLSWRPAACNESAGVSVEGHGTGSPPFPQIKTHLLPMQLTMPEPRLNTYEYSSCNRR